MALQSGDGGVGLSLQLQQGDLAGVIPHERMLCILIIPVHGVKEHRDNTGTQRQHRNTELTEEHSSNTGTESQHRNTELTPEHIANTGTQS